MPAPPWENAKVDRTPELKFIGEPGKELAVWEWPGEDPPFLFAHATGFHGRCWDRIIRMFPERRCLALDARGHGRSSGLALPYHWRIFGHDMAAVAEHWDLQRCRRHRPFQRRPHHRAGRCPAPAHLSRAAACWIPPFSRRSTTARNRWTPLSPCAGAMSGHPPDEMFERFKDRLPFSAGGRRFCATTASYGVLRAEWPIRTRLPACRGSVHL